MIEIHVEINIYNYTGFDRAIICVNKVSSIRCGSDWSHPCIVMDDGTEYVTDKKSIDKLLAMIDKLNN